MNERIEELILQAIDATYKYDLSEGFKIQEWDKIRLEKFAELIVRECAKISEECGINLNREDYRQGISRNIKQHFGVQE
jgi:hypothetical protein